MALPRAVLFTLVAITLLLLLEASLTQVSADEDPALDHDDQPAGNSTSLLRRFLSHRKKSHKHEHKHKPKPKRKTCDKSPEVCFRHGSPGRNCCHKKCVNLKNDKHNCGRCGKKCRFNQQCCRRKCVNVFRDPLNCGSCGHRCSPGTTCQRGMCGYA